MAGVVAVLVIAASAIAAGVESIRRLAIPTDITHLWTVAVADVIGFTGNQIAARKYVSAPGARSARDPGCGRPTHTRTDALTFAGRLPVRRKRDPRLALD